MSDIIRADCIEQMKNIPNNYVNLTLTDIPYSGVSKNGEERAKYKGQLRKIDKEKADELNFDIGEFLEHLYRITSGTIIVFCGQNQLSEIFNFFQEKSDGSTRQLIWKKTNPSPMNGQHIYLSAVENAVWFKKRKTTFNCSCKSNVFEFPNGRSKLHPTEKNHELLRELILDNSNFGDLVFDPCMGSGSHLLIAREEGRRILGIELNEGYFNISKDRLFNSIVPPSDSASQVVNDGLNISLKTTPNAPSKLPTATSLNNNIRRNSDKPLKSMEQLK